MNPGAVWLVRADIHVVFGGGGGRVLACKAPALQVEIFSDASEGSLSRKSLFGQEILKDESGPESCLRKALQEKSLHQVIRNEEKAS